MRRRDNNRRAFYVVQFIELPFEGIDDYVCVPYTWMIMRKATEKRSVVAYPTNEDPFVTRDRVKSKERYKDEWSFYVATVKYETDSHRDAELMRMRMMIRMRYRRIAEQRMNNYGIFRRIGLNTADTEPKFPLNKKLRIANRSQQHSAMQSYQNQYTKTNQNNFEQELLRKSAESNNYEQRQLQLSQQDSQRQLRKPKIRIGISTKPKYNRQTPTHQVTKETLSPILTNQFQGNHTKHAPVNENHLNEIDNTMRTDEWVEEETPSVHHGANSNSDTVSDHEGISDHEMSADEAPIERPNNFDGTGITSESSYADRPIVAQNSTIHQTHSKVVLEQQMLHNFAELFTQMGSTLRYTCDMFNTLRSSIIDTVKTYKKLLGAVEQFNSMQNLASSGSFSINLKPGVRQSPEERQTEVTASTSSSTQNQQSK